jgi:hypothetical protein
VEQGADKSFDLVLHYPTRRLEHLRQTLDEAGIQSNTVIFVSVR